MKIQNLSSISDILGREADADGKATLKVVSTATGAIVVESSRLSDLLLKLQFASDATLPKVGDTIVVVPATGEVEAITPAKTKRPKDALKSSAPSKSAKASGGEAGCLDASCIVK